jgi:topoisomerase-4 subunit A
MTTKETVIKVDDGLKPHTKHLKRAVTEEDILRLLDIRICVFPNLTVTAQDKIEALEGDIEVKHNLEHLIDFAIAYFTKLKRSTERTRTPNRLIF